MALVDESSHGEAGDCFADATGLVERVFISRACRAEGVSTVSQISHISRWLSRSGFNIRTARPAAESNLDREIRLHPPFIHIPVVTTSVSTTPSLDSNATEAVGTPARASEAGVIIEDKFLMSILAPLNGVKV